MITLKDISKNFQMGDQIVRAVKGIDLSIEEGAFLSIMGSSGSGKSTLLNLLGCLDIPTSGEYFLDGENVANFNDNALSEVRGSKIGFIFQAYNLLPQITVLENVMLPLIYQPTSDEDGAKKAKELIELVGLDHRLDHKPYELSGGQQQRVAIARSLINDPKLLLADEPTGNLDPETSDTLMQLLHSIAAQGTTVIMATHNYNLIDKFDGRVFRCEDQSLIEMSFRS